MDKKIRQIVSASLIAGILHSNVVTNSLAGVLPVDTRYEYFEGDYIQVDDILEEDAINVEIEGNTLVNLAHGYFETRGNAVIESSVLSEDLMNSKITSSGSIVGLKYAPLKDNTTYTIICDLNTNLSHVRYSFGNDFVSYTQGLSEPDYTNYSQGYTRVIKTITTTTDCTSVVIGNHGIENDGKYLNIKNLMLLEGEWTNKEIPEYFKGITSVGQAENNTIEVKAKNKNLFDTNNLYIENYAGKNDNVDFEISGDSIFVSKKTSHGNFVGTKIKCKKGQNYTVGFIGGKNSLDTGYGVYIYSDKLWGNLITSISNPSNTDAVYTTVTAITDELYVGIYLNATTPVGEVLEYKNVFVYEGTENEYERYQENSAILKIEEPLRALPNGTSDKIIKKNGQWVIERNCGETIYDGSNDEVWYTSSLNNDINNNMLFLTPKNDLKPENTLNDKNTLISNILNTLSPSQTNSSVQDIEGISGNTRYSEFRINISKSKLGQANLNGLRQWLNNNPITIVYQLDTPIYEPLNIDLKAKLYLDTTYISTNSNIPANLKVAVDRVANRAKEYSELAKKNPTSENIALARMWANLMKESLLKDGFQSDINNIIKIDDLSLEKKYSSSNMDLYIKSENSLVMSLNTNSIIFEDFSGVEDDIKENAVNISVSSSLPYQLNAYLATEIQNSDNSNTINKLILNIKESEQTEYKTFNALNDKVVLKDSCESGNNNQHNIDLKLNAGIAHEKDAYKTTIQFEAEQI